MTTIYICPNCNKNMSSFTMFYSGVECEFCCIEYAHVRETFVHLSNLSNKTEMLFYAVGTFKECAKKFKLKAFQ